MEVSHPEADKHGCFAQLAWKMDTYYNQWHEYSVGQSHILGDQYWRESNQYPTVYVGGHDVCSLSRTHRRYCVARTCTSAWYRYELSVYNIYHRDWCHSIDYVQTAYNTYELQPLNALAQYAKQETPVFNAGDAAGQNCQDLKWLKAINEKIDANQYYVYERHDNGVVYNYKTDKVWKQVDNPLKNGYPRGVTTMTFFRIAK